MITKAQYEEMRLRVKAASRSVPEPTNYCPTCDKIGVITDCENKHVKCGTPVTSYPPSSSEAAVKPYAKLYGNKYAAKAPAPKSYNPNIVTAYFSENGIPAPEFEYQFHPDRKWRFDLAFPYLNGCKTSRLAIEVQGGIFTQGRHNRGAAMLKEWDKLNEAAALGWRIIYVQPSELCMMDTVQLIKRALNLKS